MSKQVKRKDVKESIFRYEIGSNVIEYNGEMLYLNKILWEYGLMYDDVKDSVVK